MPFAPVKSNPYLSGLSSISPEATHLWTSKVWSSLVRKAIALIPAGPRRTEIRKLCAYAYRSRSNPFGA